MDWPGSASSVGGSLKISTVGGYCRPSDGRNRMAAAPFEKRCGFVETALPAPQFAEPGQSVRRHARTAEGELVAGVCQLALGFLPRATPHAD